MTERGRQTLDRWLQDLIDRSHRNPLLNATTVSPAGRGGSSLTLMAPGATRLLSLLLTGRTLSFAAPVASQQTAQQPETARYDQGSEVLADLRDPARLVRVLQRFARRSELDFADLGLRTLHACFGVVEWRESETAGAQRAPLLFVPVELGRGSARLGYRLRRSEGDLAWNPALEVKLEEFGAAFPEGDLGELEDAPQRLDELFGQVEAVTSRLGWSLSSQVLLMRARFARQAMYRDVRDNASRILQHRVVAALADPSLAQPDPAGAEPVDDQRLDEAAPPERAHLILDADASQRQAIEMAVRGTSFVLEGPPGTGKSQTIANLIAELIARDRSVLFVAEKTAALEVVFNRLRDQGLDEFVLRLHDSRIGRREVARQLDAALERRASPEPLPDPARVQEAELVRQQLSAYANAVNQRRDPLGRSVTWVVGRLALLHGQPVAPLPDQIGTRLEGQHAELLLQRFQDLAHVWAPVAERDQFRWHGLVEQPEPERERDALGRLLDELSVAVGELHDQLPALALAAGLPEPRSLDGAARLLAVCAHCQTQPSTEPAWWSSSELEELERLVVELAADAAAHQGDLAVLHAAYGSGWARLDVRAAGRLTNALTVVQRICPDLGRPDAQPHPGGTSELTASDDRARLESLAGLCAQTTRLVEELRPAGARLASALGAPTRERTVNDVQVLATVARDADATVRPEPSWTEPDVAERLVRVLDQLDEHLNAYQAHGARLEAVLDWHEAEQLDLARLCYRYGYAPLWQVLTRGWWQDRRQLKRATRAGRVNRAVIDVLDLALERQSQARKLDQLERDNRQLLGRFYRPRATDTSEARTAFQRLQHAASYLGSDFSPVGVAAQLAGDRPTDPDLAATARQVLGALTSWSEQVDRLAGRHTDVLTGLTLTELGTWAATTSAAVSTSVEMLDAVNFHRHTPTGLGGAQSELRLAATVNSRRRRFEELPAAQRSLIGRRYQGLESAWDDLVTGVRWTLSLQRQHGGPLPSTAAAALHANPHPPNPIHLQQRWELAYKHREELMDRFEPARRADLAAEMQGPLDEVSEVITDLTDHLDQVEIWHAFATRTRWLGEQGFAAAVDYCIHQIPDPTAVPQVLEAALWQAWYAAVATNDVALSGVRAEDLDGRVARFRELDRYLISSARGRVIQASLTRRPSFQIGPAADIKSQARRRRGNWPIRKLLSRVGPFATRLKPCFMMSPLAVSELIPPDFEFDTVVFDEASQITPANAIGCLYRAKQIIVVGDPRQLPPSRFFQSSTTADDLDDEDGDEDTPDYESMLDLCSSAAHLPSLRLRWHYRSQHDSLITFSNHRFYADQPLLVFPAATSTPPADLGVGFALVPDGKWDRTLHVNQTEAERVAEVVLAHAALHPEPSRTDFRSLGIVTCNEPQAELIEERIAQLRSDRPELDAFFNDPDPLRRWFVRSIEHVQGDERDHIILSVGYGPEKVSGKLNLNFGPLIYTQGGHRRLNVAVTRARYRLEVVASFTADDLAARHSTNPSIQALQAFLDYAERGMAALAIDRSYSDRAPESPLEQSVYDTIRAWGYTVECQIGTAGYRIDLGIRHPDLPGRFALGVECDGAAYHSSRVARDRDRLRQQLLERLGWQLYRIWGPAWYRDRRTQQHRLRTAIDAAINASPGLTASALLDDQEPQVDYIAIGVDQRPAWATTYKEYTTDLTVTGDPTSFRQRHQLTVVVRDILDVEAPIHTYLLARRVAKLWNTRARPSLRETVEHVLTELARAGVCRLDGDYAWPPDTNQVSVRTPAPDEPGTRREVIHVPDAELRVAIYNLLDDADTLEPDKLTEHVARLFGWEHTGSRIRATIERLTTQLQTERHIAETADGRLRLRTTT